MLIDVNAEWLNAECGIVRQIDAYGDGANMMLPGLASR